MELNTWALSVLIEAYEKVYNDGTTLPKDAKKIKKIIDLLKKDKQQKLTEVSRPFKALPKGYVKQQTPKGVDQ